MLDIKSQVNGNARERGLTGSFIVVNVNSFQLERAVTNIFAFWINSMFIRDDFPKLVNRENSKNQCAENCSEPAKPIRDRGLCKGAVHVSHYAAAGSLQSWRLPAVKKSAQKDKFK